ncbi:uncharacterized protein B0H64DRAFT_236903 [Chaetomium fimeti]|uniref:Uncharacterized protein n=1 Tax=Chaetomium fimeti TaxID=1854472 RepID=A0AAE0LP75_9PEZI|nr:hypothetical protein B0H64DRAFT_236903 [Chaetomium fimeti]
MSLANIPTAFLLLPFRTVYLRPLPRFSQSPRFAFAWRSAKSLSSSNRNMARAGVSASGKAKQAGAQTGVIEADEDEVG